MTKFYCITVPHIDCMGNLDNTDIRYISTTNIVNYVHSLMEQISKTPYWWNFYKAEIPMTVPARPIVEEITY